MSGFKKVLNWFVTVETNGEEEVPEAAASADPDEAAAAARQAAEQGRGGQRPAEPKRVGEVRAPQSGKTLEEELAELDKELAQGRRPASASAAPTPRATGQVLYTPPAPVAAEAFDPAEFEGSPIQPRPAEDLYAAERLPPQGQGFTVYKIEELLASPHLRGLSVEMKRASLLVAMQASGVDVESVIADAALRDRALDAHEMDLLIELEDLESQTHAQNEALEAEAQAVLRRLQQEMSENTARLEAARKAVAAWKAQKQAEERRLYEAVALFASPDKNPVSIG